MNGDTVTDSLKQLHDAIDQLSAELERSQAGVKELDREQEKLKDIITLDYPEAIAARFEKCESLLRELDARMRAMSARLEQKTEALSQKLAEQEKKREESEKLSLALRKISGETVSIDRRILERLEDKKS